MKIKVILSRQENIDHYGATEVELDLEEYLKGVVPSEIGNAHIEACAAQAVAARNFTLSKISSRGYITDKSSIDQAFRASRLTGYPNAYAGIEKTTGQVLYYNGSLARCYYSSSNGGKTVSSKEKWGGDFPYLISQEDPYDDGSKNGHGVGLSQRGAKNRANSGQTYQQILAFYFPGTTLHKESEKMTIEQSILDWCKARIGYPYIYGGTQEKCTPSYRRQKAKQYPEYSSNIYTYCPVLSGKKSSCEGCDWQGKEAYDCAQFVKWGAASVGINNVKSGATSQWNQDIWAEKGKFADIPNDKLCCVFRDKNGRKAHVGWYYGGYAYHAQGHQSGVVKTDNSEYKAWTHYAIMKGIYNDSGTAAETEVIEVLYQAKVSSTNSKLNMRKAASKTSSRITQIPPQAIVDVIEEVNSEWWKIVYNGQTGYAMCSYLTKIKTEEKEDTPSAAKEYYVKIKCESEEDAKRIAKLLATATTE